MQVGRRVMCRFLRTGGAAVVFSTLLLVVGCGSSPSSIVPQIIGGDVEGVDTTGDWVDPGEAKVTPDIPEAPCVSDDDCTPYYCDTGKNECVECLINPHCPPGHKCDGRACVKKEDGCSSDAECSAQGLVCDTEKGKCVECNASEDCPTGEFCLDGKCLDWICTPNAKWCVTTLAMQCDEDGASIASETDCNDQNVCTEGDACVNGECKVPMTKDCDDHNPCTDDDCDPEEGCYVQFNEEACDDGTDCTTGDHCENGLCVPGELVCQCAFDADCAAEDDDNLCNGKLICVNGYCVVDPSSVVQCQESENPCVDISCNANTGQCEEDEAEDGTECDDEDSCTENDVCLEGECVGEEVTCDDGNLCTADSCVPEIGCQNNPVEDECDDKNKCTWPDNCIDGVCIGEEIDCEDGNPCTDNYCLPAIGCVSDEMQGPCEDGDSCTTNDQCVESVCKGEPLVCEDDGNFCTNDYCDPDEGCVHEFNDLPCDDGNPCTTNDHCMAGECIPGETMFECDDGNPCTTDSCDLISGACLHSANSQPCDDGDPCSENDQCANSICIPGPEKDCDDGKECTEDSCNSQGACTNTPIAGPCEDGNLCTSGDTCIGGVCQPGMGVKCNDNNDCTDDACVPETGCVHTPNSNQCSDGDACTTGDKCVDGTCTPESDVDCDDDNICTDDSCDPGGGCANVPNSLPCDDGDECTQGDHCTAAFCLSGEKILCDDENLCTDDYCQPDAGCTYDPNTDPCEDEDPCTFDDMCKGGACVPGDSTDCNDDNPCTKDVCDYDHCEHQYIEGACNDGNQCTVGDECNNGLCLGTLVANCGCYSVSLDGSTGYGEVPYSAKLNLAGAFTVEVWFKLTKKGNYSLLSRWTAPGNPQASFGLSVSAAGLVGFDMIEVSDGDKSLGIKGGLVGATDWHHAAAVHDGQNVRLYVDGALAASADSVGKMVASTVPLYVGTRYSSSPGKLTGMLNGLMDEIRISNSALYSGDSFQPEPWLGVLDSTVAYWGADQGQFNTLFDTSANHLHAALNGTTSWSVDTPADECTPKANYPPSTPVVAIEPGMANATQDLECIIDEASFDMEGDIVTYTYKWFLNGAVQPGYTAATLPASATAPCPPWKCKECQEWTCAATPWDDNPGRPGKGSTSVGLSTCKDCEGSVYAGHCYVWENWQTNWSSAQSSCTQAGGYLTSVTSSAENSFVDGLCQTACWIGLTDKAVEKSWVWESGEPFDPNKANWRPLQPDNFANEDCVEMCKDCGWGQPSGKWNDLDCGKQRSFVCEKEP